MGLLKNEVNFTVTLTDWLKESKNHVSFPQPITHCSNAFSRARRQPLVFAFSSFNYTLIVCICFLNINSYSILGHIFYCTTAISLTLARRFVYHEEDFLEAATGVLRSVIDKLVSLQEPQVSYQSFFYVLGLACLGLTRFLKRTCR